MFRETNTTPGVLRKSVLRKELGGSWCACVLMVKDLESGDTEECDSMGVSGAKEFCGRARDPTPGVFGKECAVS